MISIFCGFSFLRTFCALKNIYQTETMDDQHDITWNHELEKLLADEGEKALGSAWIHGQAEGYYAARNQWITIPCVILSTLSGSASIGSQTMFSDAKTASLAIGAVSILVGILQTLGSFWTFAAKQEGHRQMEIQWAKLHRFIAVEMTLPRTERIAAKDMLKIVRETIERLSETTPLVPDNIIEAFNKKFGEAYKDVAIPDMANGLKHIAINSPPVGQTPNSRRINLTLPQSPKDGGSNNHSSNSGGSNFITEPKAAAGAGINTRPEGAAGETLVGVISEV